MIRGAGLVLATFMACGRVAAPVSENVNPPRNAPAVELPDGTAIEIELALDDATRAQGLMFRESLAPGKGMLFLHTTTEIHPFWMKNTLIPLDMIWIDESRRVVHIERDVPPCKADPCPSYVPEVPSKYTLEVAAGQAAAHRLKVGDPLRFRNIDESLIRGGARTQS